MDTSALIAILKDEPERAHFAGVIAASSDRFLSAVSVMEASFVLAGRHHGSAIWGALDILLVDLKLRVVAFDESAALLAREAFLRYGKGRHPAALNMGDCASYALAKARGLPLLFKGGDFARTDIQAAG